MVSCLNPPLQLYLLPDSFTLCISIKNIFSRFLYLSCSFLPQGILHTLMSLPGPFFCSFLSSYSDSFSRSHINYHFLRPAFIGTLCTMYLFHSTFQSWNCPVFVSSIKLPRAGTNVGFYSFVHPLCLKLFLKQIPT